ncbi:hypothetical protein ACWEPM_32955 [Streptomyces sp. NPDC004244]
MPLLGLVYALLVIAIGAGLLYVTLAHPQLAMPLTVAVAGITLVITLPGILLTLIHRR